MTTPTLAFVTSRLRVEEKLLLGALERRGVAVERIDDGALALSLTDPGTRRWSAVWNRSLAFYRTLYATRALEARGELCVNTAAVVETCGDKVLTSLALTRAGVPSPRTSLAFTPEAALEVVTAFGFPCVMKPVVGSWGRLVSRINDLDGAEALFEHRAVLGSPQHQLYYLQEFVAKPGRDARVFVAGGEPLAAIWRHSAHWITNTARGAKVEGADPEGELGTLAVRAAAAVGGGLVAVDLIETPDGLAVLEVNHSGEFRNSIEPTGVDLPGAMTDWVLSQLRTEVPA